MRARGRYRRKETVPCAGLSLSSKDAFVSTTLTTPTISRATRARNSLTCLDKTEICVSVERARYRYRLSCEPARRADEYFAIAVTDKQRFDFARKKRSCRFAARTQKYALAVMVEIISRNIIVIYVWRLIDISDRDRISMYLNYLCLI